MNTLKIRPKSGKFKVNSPRSIMQDSNIYLNLGAIEIKTYEIQYKTSNLHPSSDSETSVTSAAVYETETIDCNNHFVFVNTFTIENSDDFFIKSREFKRLHEDDLFHSYSEFDNASEILEPEYEDDYEPITFTKLINTMYSYNVTNPVHLITTPQSSYRIIKENQLNASFSIARSSQYVSKPLFINAIGPAIYFSDIQEIMLGYLKSKKGTLSVLVNDKDKFYNAHNNIIHNILLLHNASRSNHSDLFSQLDSYNNNNNSGFLTVDQLLLLTKLIKRKGVYDFAKKTNMITSDDTTTDSEISTQVKLYMNKFKRKIKPFLVKNYEDVSNFKHDESTNPKKDLTLLASVISSRKPKYDFTKTNVSNFKYDELTNPKKDLTLLASVISSRKPKYDLTKTNVSDFASFSSSSLSVNSHKDVSLLTSTHSRKPKFNIYKNYVSHKNNRDHEIIVTTIKERPAFNVLPSSAHRSSRFDFSKNKTIYLSNDVEDVSSEIKNQPVHRIDFASSNINRGKNMFGFDTHSNNNESHTEVSSLNNAYLIKRYLSKNVGTLAFPQIESNVIQLLDTDYKLNENERKSLLLFSNQINRDNLLFKRQSKLLKYHHREIIHRLIETNNVVKYNIYELSSQYNTILPLNVYTCWHTKNLPPKMSENYKSLVLANPELKFSLFDESDCREFIDRYFDKSVLHAYDTLIPSSYKSDLWRFCVLHKCGGIYMDIKYKCASGFKLIELCEKEHFVMERNNIDWEPGTFGIYTALIAVKPYNNIIGKCIKRIVENVSNKYYGFNALYPTGPGLLGYVYFKNKTEEDVENEIQVFFSNTQRRIIYKNASILEVYPEYRSEQLIYQNDLHYSKLWENSNIYKLDIEHAVKNEFSAATASSKNNILVICHIGNFAVFEKMRHYISLVYSVRNKYNVDVVFNLVKGATSNNMETLCAYYPDANIIVSENYGFDIGSFFHTLNIVKDLNYDYVLKLHTKTDDVKRFNVLDSIVSSREKIMGILEMLDTAPNVGCVSSVRSFQTDDSHERARNKHHLSDLISLYGLNSSHTNIPFPAGCMFWMRFDILKSIYMKVDLTKICQSLNTEHTFDYNWFYYAHYNSVNKIKSKNALYDIYWKNRHIMSKNLFEAVRVNSQAKELRDGMIEHAYERLFAYAVDFCDKRIQLV